MTGDLAPVHDPCIIKADGLYHVFCTGQKAEPTGLIPWRTSPDLVNWTVRGKVFDAIPSWAEQAPLNPGPHQFHADPGHFRAWARRRGHYLCRLSEVPELMRPVPLPVDPPAWGVCDAQHREDHEFVPA